MEEDNWSRAKKEFNIWYLNQNKKLQKEMAIAGMNKVMVECWYRGIESESERNSNILEAWEAETHG